MCRDEIRRAEIENIVRERCLRLPVSTGGNVVRRTARVDRIAVVAEGTETTENHVTATTAVTAVTTVT